MCSLLLSVAMINATPKSCLPPCFPWIAQLLFLRSPGPPAHSGRSLWHQFVVKNLLYRHARRSVPWRGSSTELPYSQMRQADSWRYNSDSQHIWNSWIGENWGICVGNRGRAARPRPCKWIRKQAIVEGEGTLVRTFRKVEKRLSRKSTESMWGASKDKNRLSEDPWLHSSFLVISRSDHEVEGPHSSAMRWWALGGRGRVLLGERRE